MPKGQPHSSNCLLLEGKLEEIIHKLDNISLSDLRQGASIMPIVAAIRALEDLKKSLPEIM